MIPWGWCGGVALALCCCGSVAAACPPGELPGLAVVRLIDGAVLHEAQADSFALSWRHSVTLTPVLASYSLDAGVIRQTEERFSAHGPGMASDGQGWRKEGDVFVLPMDRAIDRLILRTAPAYENHLLIDGTEIDLTLWPRQPLELKPLPCKDIA